MGYTKFKLSVTQKYTLKKDNIQLLSGKTLYIYICKFDLFLEKEKNRKWKKKSDRHFTREKDSFGKDTHIKNV